MVDHVKMLGSPAGGWGRLTSKTADPSEAEHIVASVYVGNRLVISAEQRDLDMELVRTQVGSITAGHLRYGREVRMVTDTLENFHVNVPLRGRVLSQSGRHTAATSPGRAAVFGPGWPAGLSWSADCVQLCLMVASSALESELEQLLGRSLDRPLDFDFEMDLTGELGRRWQPALQLLTAELNHPTGILQYSASRRHIEGLVLDGLLLAQRHNFSEELARAASPGPRGAVGRAAELMCERPEEAWGTVRLASEVGLSVRSLQEGFRRHFEMPPSVYLRRVRLERVREMLTCAEPGSVSVHEVARRCGFLHMGRFSAAYRDVFGERPSDTLRRDRA